MAKSVDQPAPVKIRVWQEYSEKPVRFEGYSLRGIVTLSKRSSCDPLIVFCLQIDQSRKKKQMVEREKVHVWPYLVKEAENGAIVV